MTLVKAYAQKVSTVTTTLNGVTQLTQNDCGTVIFRGSDTGYVVRLLDCTNRGVGQVHYRLVNASSVEIEVTQYPGSGGWTETLIPEQSLDVTLLDGAAEEGTWNVVKSMDESSYFHYSGFDGQTLSTITINSGTGVLTLAPTTPGVPFTVWAGRRRWVFDAAQTVTITADQTITYAYIDVDGALKSGTGAWNILGDAAPCAIVFKDGATYRVTDERHVYNRSKVDHSWKHKTVGCVWRSGLVGTFTNTTLSMTQGVIADEDLEHDTGGTKTTCSLWYRNATSGMRMLTGSTTPYKLVGTNLQYDNGSGTLQSVGVNAYVMQWVYGTADTLEPIYVVLGQVAGNLATVRNSPRPTINLSTAEWKLLYSVIYRSTGAVPTYVEAQDYRLVSTGVPTSPAAPTSHTILIDRDAAGSHPATAISTTAGDVQTDLNGKADVSHSATHQAGGAYAIKLDDLATPDDNTDLNATTTRHGLLPKLSGATTTYLRADGTWVDPRTMAPVAVVVSSTPYTVLATDNIIFVDTTTLAITITVPTAEIARLGRSLKFVDKSRNAANNVITIETQGAETISGESNAIIDIDGASLDVVSDGSNLYVV